jgi:two-component system, response regulator PdtaR
LDPKQAAPPSPIPVAPSALPRQRLHLVFSRDDGTASDVRPAAAPRILIVEDDFLVSMQMETALREAGFELIGVATSAEEAIAMAAAHQPALAVMDIRLAGERDGIDAATELFRDYGTRCIFATAHQDADALRRAAPAAPLGWLRKPYTMVSLIETVRQGLRDLGR